MQQALDKSFEYDVFICHSSKDKPIITTLIEDLKKENITYWVDAEQITFGDSITEKITEGLETSNYVIPCVSKNLTTSGWTRAEYGSILNAEFSGYSKRKVIPLLIEDCDVNDIPTLLRDKRRVTYSNKTEFIEFINFLKKKRLNETGINPLTSLNVSSDSQLKNPVIPETFISPSTGIKLTLIPEGEFIMGSENLNNEKPVHKVIIKNSFYLGKYPVTHKQWNTIMDSNFLSSNKDDFPVTISWNEAIEFTKKLNLIEGENKYRLPSEAEWEYACRAGTTTRYFFGDDESTLGEYSWYGFRNFFGNTHPVGEKKPNPLGLYDIYGNVNEWCQDKWHDNYNGAPSDGSAWESGNSTTRVVRGGVYNSLASYCRSATRKNNNPDKRRIDTGFRIVREV